MVTPIIHNTVLGVKVVTHTHTQKDGVASCHLNLFWGKLFGIYLSIFGFDASWNRVFIH